MAKHHSKTYEHINYSYLLQEFYGEKKPVASTYSNRQNSKTSDEAKKKRSSLMKDNKMLFIYSSEKKVLHDRSCRRAREIGDINFRMLSSFPTPDRNFQFCSHCYRRMLIRQGIGKQDTRISSCENFFDSINAEVYDIYRLLIQYKATIRWLDARSIQVTLHDDAWQIRKIPNQPLELWHNNYVVLPDYSRQFTKGFHRQLLSGNQDFHEISKRIISYSWTDHVKIRIREDERKENKEKGIAIFQENKRRKQLKKILQVLFSSKTSEIERREARAHLYQQFDKGQVRNILRGKARGLSIAQIMIYANPVFSIRQMRQLRDAQELHLSKSTVKRFAIMDMHWKTMRRMKWKLYVSSIQQRKLSFVIKDFIQYLLLKFKKVPKTLRAVEM